ncbi:MAG: LemA family protein [Clostridiales bacterium]|nr:LemA family protein [Clostridiales bacterium]
METFGGMVRTSRLIYNDSVSKLNREVRKFPASAVAKASGLKQRDYLGEGARSFA